MIKLILQRVLTLIRLINQKKCMFCHYWYYLNKNFNYGPFTCDGCYDIVQRSTDFKNIAIIYVKKTAYRVYFKDISKNKAKTLMSKFNLVGKLGDTYCND